jgi:hypothetical protein
MNSTTTTKYTAIRDGYKTDPRWVEAATLAANPETEADEYRWALSRKGDLERACERSAEQFRVGA